LTITMTFIATSPWNEGTCLNNINPLTPPGHQRAQPRVTQDKAAPEQCAENDREQDFEQAILMMHMGGNRSTEVASQQDSAENGSLGDQVEDSTGKQDDSEGNNHVLRISKLPRGIHDKIRLHELHRAVQEQKERGQGAHDSSGPKGAFRNGRRS